MAETATSTPKYQPGVCNIGPTEVRRRRQGAVAATIATIIFVVAALAFNLAWPWRLIVFLSAAGAAVSWLQVGLHFCAGFGIKGVFNVAQEAGKVTNVGMMEYAAADRRKALQIIGCGVLIGVVMTVGLVVV